VIPVVLAILITFVLAPLVHWLERKRLRRVPSAVLVVGLACAVVAGILLVVLFQVQSLADALHEHKDDIVAKMVHIRESSKGSWFEKVTDTIETIHKQLFPESGGAGASKGVEPVLVKIETSTLPELLQRVASPTLEGLVNVGLVILLVVFMLVHRENLRNRLISLKGTGSLTSMTRALDDAAQRISRFLQMQLVINVGYGTALGIGLFVIGIPYAVLWGFLAVVLRYIPYLGGVIAAFFPLALGLALLPGWTPVLLAAAYILVLELITANVAEPLLFGHSIGASAVALLIAAVFWAWLWGPAGLVLATPLTACLVVLGRYVPQLEFISILLGDQAGLEAPVRYYQRLLARDEYEATDLVEEYVEAHSPEKACEEVLLPALMLVKQSHEYGELTQADQAFFLQVTREVIDDLLPAPLPDRKAPGERSSEVPEKQVLVLGCPARDEADEVALDLLGRVVARANCRFEIVPHELLLAEMMERIQEQQPAVVVIASLLQDGLAHTRYLCKRIHARFPLLKIHVGCWGLTHHVDRLRRQLQAVGADDVATSFAESQEKLLPQIQFLSHAPEELSERVGHPATVS
jgi:predicted PurR-regulated permease PerM